MGEVKLSSLLSGKRSSVDPRSFPNEKFDLFSIPAHDKGGFETVSGREIGSPKQEVRPGDVLLSRIVPHIRRVRVVPNPTGHRQVASGEWVVFRSTLIEPSYLRQFLLSDSFHQRFMNTVAGVGGSLSRGRIEPLKNLALILPDKDRQIQLSNALEAAEKAIDLHQEQLKILDALGRSIYSTWFDNKSYPYSRIDEVTECLDSKRKPVAAADRPDGSIPYYGANNQQGWIDRALFDESLILVAEDGGRFDTPERGVAYRIDGPSWVNNHAHVLRPKAQINIEYLHQTLRHFDFQSYISGSTRSKLNQKQLNSVEIRVPPLEIQNSFEQQMNALSSQRTKIQNSERKTRDLLAAMKYIAFGDLSNV